MYACLSNLKYGEDIEDFSTAVLRTEDGTVCTIETAYAYPSTKEDVRDIGYYLTTTNGYMTIQEGEFTWTPHKGEKIKKNISTKAEDYYPVFMQKTLSASTLAIVPDLK